MKPITLDTIVGINSERRDIRAERLQVWAYNQLAAAPDLLETLKAMVDQAKENYPHFESPRGQRNIVNAMTAIAKAEGR